MSILVYFGFIILAIIIGTYSVILIEEDHSTISIVLLITAVMCLSFMFADIKDTPTALDVYQGNTELRITYEGKVPVDSVVIYKKKVHETE